MKNIKIPLSGVNASFQTTAKNPYLGFTKEMLLRNEWVPLHSQGRRFIPGSDSVVSHTRMSSAHPLHPSLLHTSLNSLIHASVGESRRQHKRSLSETDACYILIVYSCPSIRDSFACHSRGLLMQCVLPGSPQEKKKKKMFLPVGMSRWRRKACFHESSIQQFTVAKVCSKDLPSATHGLRKKQYSRQQISTLEARVP